jgi:D-3-phosphoglycerate dehydrogenase
MTRVLITCRQMQNVYETFRPRFEAAGLEVDMPSVVQQPTEDELCAIIGQYDGMIAGDDPLTARVLAHADRMKIISKWGVGIDGIDLDAAAAKGIPVTNTPGAFGEDVADLALGYLLSLTRQIPRIHASVLEGGWLKVEGTRLTGRTAGIVAFGSIGQAVARRLKGFGTEVLALDPTPAAAEAARAMGVEMVERNALFARSSVIVLCAPLTPETRHIVNDETLGHVSPGSFLVNVGRGPLVDEEALERALSDGRISAAALDVFEVEPLSDQSPLRDYERCVFGSHNASNTAEGVLAASERAAQNLFIGLGA